MKKIILAAVAVMGTTMGSSVWAAACSGNVQATSCDDSVAVDLVIPQKIKSTGLGDVTVTWDGTTIASGTSTGISSGGCIGTNSKDGAEIYATTVAVPASSILVDTFAMAGTLINTDSVAYTLSLNGTPIPLGAASTPASVPTVGTLGCTGTAHKLTATVQNTTIGGVEADSYSQTVTLVIAPQ